MSETLYSEGPIRIQLFGTCLVDAIYPEVGEAVLQILEKCGVEISFPPGQTCCGQPAYNAGYHKEARAAAEYFLSVFNCDEPILVPSGSCAAMIKHHYPGLFSGDQKLRAAAERVGARVYELTEFLVQVLKERGVKMVAKGKSMVSEEIHLNPYLEKQGFEVVETDLGEYIIQLDHETPSHIIVPAIHKNRRQVGRLFADRLGVAYSDDPQVLTKIARKVLREKFLTADAGLTGANFAIAESGSLVIFTNEGNGRMVTTVPPLHIALLSIEKILPSLRDLPTFIRLLPSSATGQAITSYVSIITGTRKSDETTGAKELHIVLLDNGRSEILAGDCREMLKCIRCGACMNVCPVYRTVGGHAYGATYPGPMGIVLTTLLTGMAASHPLIDASTLCGACNEVCPVKIPLTKLIVNQRQRRVAEGFTPAAMGIGMRLFGIAARSPFLFSSGERLAEIFWPIMRMLGGKDVTGRVQRPSPRPFRRRVR